MLVRYQLLDHPIFRLCLDLAQQSDDGVFTIRQFLVATVLSSDEVLEHFAWLLKHDWVFWLPVGNGFFGRDLDDEWGIRQHALTPYQCYEILGIEGHYFRILSDANSIKRPNDPVLFSQTCFSVVDASEPVFWVSQYGEEGERYAYPAEWHRFFDRFHEGEADAVRVFWSVLKQRYPDTWRERRLTN